MRAIAACLMARSDCVWSSIATALPPSPQRPPAALPCPWWRRRTRRVTLCFRQTCAKPRFLDYILPKQFCEYRVRCQTRDETDSDREEDGPLCVFRDGVGSGDQLRICRQLRDDE